MRHFGHRSLIVLAIVASMGTSISPIHAQQSPTLPPLAEVSSIEWDNVTAFNGVPWQVCKAQGASSNSLHNVCHDLVTASYPDLRIDFVAGRVTEEIRSGGKYYRRINDEPTWTVSEDVFYDPSITSIVARSFPDYLAPRDVVISNLGRSLVNGVAATHFQFWSTNKELNTASGGQFVYDVFVSDDHHVLKDQYSSRGELPMGKGTLEIVYVETYNRAVNVGPPPADRVRADP